MVQPPDLPDIARNVGATGRANCGSCHFYGGGGDGVKHGDLDSSLVSPAPSLDVHMSPDGADFSCSDCHTTWGHSVSGSRYQVNAKDTLGIDTPGHTDLSRASCESCHGDQPHTKTKLNDHVDKLACQTCHVPAFARGGVPTKMWWDWSTAGTLDENKKPICHLLAYYYRGMAPVCAHSRWPVCGNALLPDWPLLPVLNTRIVKPAKPSTTRCSGWLTCFSN